MSKVRSDSDPNFYHPKAKRETQGGPHFPPAPSHSEQVKRKKFHERLMISLPG